MASPDSSEQPDILAEIHRFPPVDTRFVAGRWHRDRMALGGYLIEGRVFLRTAAKPGRPRRKFLVIGRARSGTTLFGRLLNAHSRIRCDREVLSRNVLAPATFLDRLARKSPTEIYGAKLLSYQMVQVHRLRDPVGFLRNLQGRGFRFIHLTRGTLAQSLSLAVAQSSRKFHSDRGAAPGRKTIRLDPQDFLARVAWSDALLRYERRCLRDLDHLAVSYEADLMTSERQNATVARVCDWLGVPPEPVAAPLKKLLPDDPRRIIENYDEVARALRDGGFGHLLPEDGTA